MKVSILMPCFNAGDYLYKSIGSIQESTIQDFEIIAVNDGSTENTLEILKELQAKDNRIKIITREEKGFAFTFNDALNAARGEYVLNVDPDDWISPLMLERMLEEVEDCDFVKCGFWFEFGESREEYLYDAPDDIFCPRLLLPDVKMKYFVSQVAIWSCLIRRSFIEKWRIRLNETEGAAYQDTGFIWQINTIADKVKVIKEPLYHYNKTNSNASTASSRYPMAPSVEYNRIAEWLVNHPWWGLEVRPVLCRARFGSYCWNMNRIKKADRLKFALQAQKDFKSDWGYMDVRMFTENEFNVFMLAKERPEDFVKLFEKGENN